MSSCPSPREVLGRRTHVVNRRRRAHLARPAGHLVGPQLGGHRDGAPSCGPGRPVWTWPWAKAGEETHDWNDSSSRQRVTTSHWCRSSVGRSSSKPSKPSWSSTAPARAANAASASSLGGHGDRVDLDGTVGLSPAVMAPPTRGHGSTAEHHGRWSGVTLEHSALVASSVRHGNLEATGVGHDLSSKFDQVVKGRNLIILAASVLVLFVIANVAYGGGNQHGVRNDVSNVTWAVFLHRLLRADPVRPRLPGSGDSATRQGPRVTFGRPPPGSGHPRIPLVPDGRGLKIFSFPSAVRADRRSSARREHHPQQANRRHRQPVDRFRPARTLWYADTWSQPELRPSLRDPSADHRCS